MRRSHCAFDRAHRHKLRAGQIGSDHRSHGKSLETLDEKPPSLERLVIDLYGRNLSVMGGVLWNEGGLLRVTAIITLQAATIFCHLNGAFSALEVPFE